MDPRDYQKATPFSFSKLADQWLESRKADGIRCMRNLRRHMKYATDFSGQQNIKSIQYGNLEDFFHHLRRTTNLADKSIYNIRTTLKAFVHWVAKREKNIQRIEFPEVRFDSPMRKTLSFEEQATIIEGVKRISWNDNPKIYLGILWLATYPNLRPIEMLNILEGDIDLINGSISIRYSKVEGQYKRIYLIPEDMEFLRSLPRGLPHMPFFRRRPRKKGQPAGKRFGKDHFSIWWRRACENLNIRGVPLYPGTRHSKVSNLSFTFSPEEIMGCGTDHRTNKAFYRYFQMHADRRREISSHVRSAHHLHINSVQEKSKKGKDFKG